MAGLRMRFQEGALQRARILRDCPARNRWIAVLAVWRSPRAPIERLAAKLRAALGAPSVVATEASRKTAPTVPADRFKEVLRAIAQLKLKASTGAERQGVSGGDGQRYPAARSKAARVSLSCRSQSPS